MSSESQHEQLPTPDPALKRLDRLVGTWTMEGGLVGSEEKNITGEVTFRWLPGGFFLENHTILNFMGTERGARVDRLRPRNEDVSFYGLLQLLPHAPSLRVGDR
jgi:hypothetical protein